MIRHRRNDVPWRRRNSRVPFARLAARLLGENGSVGRALHNWSLTRTHVPVHSPCPPPRARDGISVSRLIASGISDLVSREEPLGRAKRIEGRIRAGRARHVIAMAMTGVALLAAGCLDDRGTAPSDQPTLRLGIN